MENHINNIVKKIYDIVKNTKEHHLKFCIFINFDNPSKIINLIDLKNDIVILESKFNIFIDMYIVCINSSTPIIQFNKLEDSFDKMCSKNNSLNLLNKFVGHTRKTAFINNNNKYIYKKIKYYDGGFINNSCKSLFNILSITKNNTIKNENQYIIDKHILENINFGLYHDWIKDNILTEFPSNVKLLRNLIKITSCTDYKWIFIIDDSIEIATNIIKESNMSQQLLMVVTNSNESNIIELLDLCCKNNIPFYYHSILSNNLLSSIDFNILYNHWKIDCYDNIYYNPLSKFTISQMLNVANILDGQPIHTKYSFNKTYVKYTLNNKLISVDNSNLFYWSISYK